MAGRRESFIDRLLAGEPPHIDDAAVGREAYAARIVAGGFPDAQGRSARGRARFFDSYVASILGRDLQDIASVRDTGSVERLPLGTTRVRPLYAGWRLSVKPPAFQV